MQAAEFADAHAGGIQERNLGLVLRVGNRINDGNDLSLGRYNRKVLVEMEERDFPLIPVFVEHVVKEVPELCDVDVDSAGIQSFHILKPPDIGADLFPGNRGKGAAGKIVLDPADIGCKVRSIGRDGAFGEVAERKDIPVFFEISSVRFKHYKALHVKKSVNSYRFLCRRSAAGLEKNRKKG